MNRLPNRVTQGSGSIFNISRSPLRRALTGHCIIANDPTNSLLHSSFN